MSVVDEARHCIETGIYGTAGVGLNRVLSGLLAEIERLRATGADASAMLTAYGESTHALADLARSKGATQDEVDRAMLGDAYKADENHAIQGGTEE
jgi:Zn-dependent protease with chaperone function